MKVGQPPPVSAIHPPKAAGAVVLSGPGFSVSQIGVLYLLRALPVLTGGRGVIELRLDETEMTALKSGETTVEKLLQQNGTAGGPAAGSDGGGGGAGDTQLSLSDTAQRALQAGLLPDQTNRNRRHTTGAPPAPRGRKVQNYNGLTLAALAFAIVVAVVIWLGAGP